VDGFLGGGLVDVRGVVDVTQSRYEDGLNMVLELGVAWCGAVVVMVGDMNGLHEQLWAGGSSIPAGGVWFWDLGSTMLGMWFVVGVSAGIAVESGKISTSDFEADAEIPMDRESKSMDSRNIIDQVLYEV
jgi:hypothetical protein